MALTLTNDILKFRESTSDPWERLLIQANMNFNLIYPVGSIYMSTVNVDPGTIFGGTWEQLKDTFLLGAGDNYTAGDTGGEAEHTLTGSELPTTSGSFKLRRMSWGTGANQSAAIISGPSGMVTGVQSTGSGVDSVSYYNGASRAWDEVALSFGSDAAHNNMPPYLVVYMWRRLTLSPTIYTPPASVLIGEVASEDIVPIAKGGTGATTLESAKENLEVGEVLLWTSTSPGSMTTATVDLNLSTYRRVRIDFCPWGQTNLIESQEFYIGSSSSSSVKGCLSYTAFNSDNVTSAATFLNGVYRMFDVYSTGIVFQNGQMIYSGNVYQNWDSRAVPYRIWGVR